MEEFKEFKKFEEFNEHQLIIRKLDGRDELLLIRSFSRLKPGNAEEQAAAASLWRALVIRPLRIEKLGRDEGLA